MPTLPEDAKRKINPRLASRLEAVDPPQIDLLVEVEEGALDDVTADLQGFGLSPRQPRFNFIPVTAPQDIIPEITRIPGVVQVHKNEIKTIGSTAQPRQDTQPRPRRPDLVPLDLLSRQDEFGETFSLSSVEIPGIPLLALPTIPISPLLTPVQSVLGNISSAAAGVVPFTGPTPPDVDVVLPTGQTRGFIGAPEDNAIESTKCAVLDTGPIPVGHPLWRKSQSVRSFTGELPVDGQGHGSWCQACAFGGEAPTRFGPCKGVANVPGELAYGGKVLTNIGFGTSEGILAGMEWVVENGVDVCSMSLGGPLQGSVQDDPEVKVIQKTSKQACGDEGVIWVIAAGNDSGDGVSWNIGSPGAAPDALTCAAYSIVGEGVADFSSRGWSGEFYEQNPDAFQQDLRTFGQALRKPDVMGPGGGPSKGSPRDDIYSAAAGWADLLDLTLESLVNMRGTSMATPHVAGLVALLYDRGLISTARDVKLGVRRGVGLGSKNPASGWGLVHWSQFT